MIKKLVIIVAFLILIVLVVGGGAINNGINSAFNPIDKSCNVDEDCYLMPISCTPEPCDRFAVNGNWEPLCPVPSLNYGPELAIGCLPPAGELKCVNNQCEYILNTKLQEQIEDFINKSGNTTLIGNTF